MRDFHIIVRPKSRFTATGTSELNGVQVTTYSLDTSSVSSFSLSYEELEEILSQIPRLFIEPDGSFVWVSPEDPERKLNGQITDDGQRVMFIELRGTCRFDEVVPVLQGLGWPENGVLCQWLPEAVLMDVEAVRAAIG